MKILYFTNENSKFFIGCSLAIFQEFIFFPKKLVTQPLFNFSDNIQAGVYKGITSHEQRTVLFNLAPPASTEQMITLSQNSFENMRYSCVLREEINILIKFSLIFN